MKSDRRYLTRDSFVVCMETITAFFWGPLSFSDQLAYHQGQPPPAQSSDYRQHGSAIWGCPILFHFLLRRSGVWSRVLSAREHILLGIFCCDERVLGRDSPWVIAQTAAEIAKAFAGGNRIETQGSQKSR